jgi:plastocyanin
LPASGSYYGFINDASGNMWFSDVDNGYVYKFDGAEVTQFAGFHRPLGLAPSGGYVYVAENVRAGDNPSWSPAIAKLNPVDGSITRMTVTGSPYGITTFSILTTTYIAYSSSGEDSAHTCGIGVGVFGGSVTFFNIAVPAVYYLHYEPTSNALYFTFYGSGSGVGEFSDPASEVLLASDSNTVDVAVNQLPVYETSLTLEADKTTIFVGDSITFTSTLKYANGTKAGQSVGAGKPIKLLVNGQEVASGQTDANGQWSCTYTFNNVGTYTVQSKFPGGTFSPYYSESSSATVKILVVEAVSPWSTALTVAAFVAVAIVVGWILAKLSEKYRIKVEKVEA